MFRCIREFLYNFVEFVERSGFEEVAIPNESNWVTRHHVWVRRRVHRLLCKVQTSISPYIFSLIECTKALNGIISNDNSPLDIYKTNCCEESTRQTPPRITHNLDAQASLWSVHDGQPHCYSRPQRKTFDPALVSRWYPAFVRREILASRAGDRRGWTASDTMFLEPRGQLHAY